MNIQKTYPILVLAFALSACHQKDKSETHEEEHVAICCAPSFEKAASDSIPVPVTETPSYTIKLPGANAVALNGLVDHTGDTLDNKYIAKQIAGKKLCIYFGFPDCKVFCPPSGEAIIEAAGHFEKGVVYLFIASKTGYSPAQMKEWRDRAGTSKINATYLTGPAEKLEELYTKLHVIDASKNHVPYLAFIDASGKFMGGVSPLNYSGQGNTYYPAPENIIRGLQDKFGLIPRDTLLPAREL